MIITGFINRIIHGLISTLIIMAQCPSIATLVTVEWNSLVNGCLHARESGYRWNGLACRNVDKLLCTTKLLPTPFDHASRLLLFSLPLLHLFRLVFILVLTPCDQISNIRTMRINNSKQLQTHGQSSHWPNTFYVSGDT